MQNQKIPEILTEVGVLLGCDAVVAEEGTSSWTLIHETCGTVIVDLSGLGQEIVLKGVVAELPENARDDLLSDIMIFNMDAAKNHGAWVTFEGDSDFVFVEMEAHLKDLTSERLLKLVDAAFNASAHVRDMLNKPRRSQNLVNRRIAAMGGLI